MSDVHAFALRPPLTLDGLVGASVAFGPQAQHLDIKAALEAGGGEIVTDHPDVIATLRTFPDLEEVQPPDSDEDSDEEVEITPLSVELPQVGGSTPVEFIPEASTDPNLPTVVGDPLLPPDVEAVHADEPQDVDDAAKQPESQASAQDQAGYEDEFSDEDDDE